MEERWSYQLLFDAEPGVAAETFEVLDTALGPIVKTLENQHRGARFHLNRWRGVAPGSGYMYEVTFEHDDSTAAAETAADLEEPLLSPLGSTISECERRFSLRNVSRLRWSPA